MIEELLKEITDWQSETFKQATPLSAAKHLRKEIDELLVDLENGNIKNTAEETADCFLLIVAVAHLSRINLLKAVRDKLEINKQRTWGEVNEEGFVEHVRGTLLDVFKDQIPAQEAHEKISIIRMMLDGELPG